MIRPSMEALVKRALDVSGPDVGVEVEIREDGTVVWVSVDGVTLLRVGQCPRIDVVDHRRKPSTGET